MKRRNFIRSLFLMPAVALWPWSLPKKRRMVLLNSVVAGFQYYNGERVWRRLKEDAPLRLVREPQNPYDSNAIEVYWRSEKLGYVPRVDNSVLARLMDSGTSLQARIKQLKESADPWQRVSIEVWMDE